MGAQPFPASPFATPGPGRGFADDEEPRIGRPGTSGLGFGEPDDEAPYFGGPGSSGPGFGGR